MTEWYNDDDIGTDGALASLAERRGLSLEQLRARRDHALAFLDEGQEGHLSLNELYLADPDLPPVAWGEGLDERARLHLRQCDRCQALAESLTHANVARQVTRTASRIWPPPHARDGSEFSDSLPGGAVESGGATPLPDSTSGAARESVATSRHSRLAIPAIGMGAFAAMASVLALTQFLELRDTRSELALHREMGSKLSERLLRLSESKEATDVALATVQQELATLATERAWTVYGTGNRSGFETALPLTLVDQGSVDEAMQASILSSSLQASLSAGGETVGTVTPWKKPEGELPFVTVASARGEMETRAVNSPAPFAFSHCDGRNVVLEPALDGPSPAPKSPDPECLGGQVSQWLEEYDRSVLYLQPWAIGTETVLQR